MADSVDNIQTYRQMLKVDRRSRVFALLAELLCAAGQWEEASEVCRKGLIFHPDHLRARVLLGWALMEMGDVHDSERILLTAVDEMRKNVIAFKLLAKFAVFSDDAQGAGEYSRIYEAFMALGSAEGATAPPPEAGRREPALPSKTEVSEPDSFKVETTKEPPGMVSQDIPAPVTPVIEDRPQAEPKVSQDIPAPVTPVIENRPQAEPDEILMHLVQRIEGRFHQKALPDAILSEDDKKMLKEEIVAVLGA